MSATVIPTERLDLVLLSPAALDAMVAGRFEDASAQIGARNPRWPEPLDFLPIFRERIAAYPGAAEWLARAIVLREPAREVVGHIGFHVPPDGTGTVEIGYTVFEAHRARGIATEAARALVSWAFREGVSRVVASISPDNAPSLAVAARLGFRRVGEREDEVDGLEFIFELPRGAWRDEALLPATGHT